MSEKKHFELGPFLIKIEGPNKVSPAHVRDLARAVGDYNRLYVTTFSKSQGETYCPYGHTGVTVNQRLLLDSIIARCNPSKEIVIRSNVRSMTSRVRNAITVARREVKSKCTLP